MHTFKENMSKWVRGENQSKVFSAAFNIESVLPWANMCKSGTYCRQHIMNSMKLVIPLHSLYWSIHTKDESKHGTAFAFIFGVNWLWCCGVTASFRVFFHEMKCNWMTSFMEFMYFMWFPTLTPLLYFYSLLPSSRILYGTVKPMDCKKKGPAKYAA